MWSIDDWNNKDNFKFALQAVHHMNITGILKKSPLYIIIFVEPRFLYAHTISQHLEELYGETYLPLFIIAKILPFVGLGMLSSWQGKSVLPFKNYWVMIFGICLGFLLSLINHEFNLLLIANNLGIVVIGLLLLAMNIKYILLLQLFLLLAGCSLGYEYSLNIAHADEFRWLFISLLMAGLLIFMLLHHIDFYKRGVHSVIRIISGFLLVLAGLIVVLLT